MSIERILAGDRRALAKFLTALERDRAAVSEELAQLFPHAKAATIGITGAPGVGKSALVSALTMELRRRARQVAIIAVDPSSPFSGGAILGDRIRMRALSGDRGVFIRSMANRGNLGGLAWATQDFVRVLSAAGFDDVIIETVGAGQSEVEVAGLAQTTIVALASGAGDSVQALKAGILEIGDILVVNKSDIPGAQQTANTLQAMLTLGHPSKPLPPGAPPWQPPLLCVSALKASGIDDLAGAVFEHRQYLGKHGLLALLREEQICAELRARLTDTIAHRLFGRPELAGIIKGIAAGDLDPQTVVDSLLDEHSNIRSL